MTGATAYTDDEGHAGVKATIRDPVERDGKKYSVLKTTWQVVVKTLLSNDLQEKFKEGAELPCTAQKADGKKYYVLA